MKSAVFLVIRYQRGGSLFQIPGKTNSSNKGLSRLKSPHLLEWGLPVLIINYVDLKFQGREEL
jgi:hypothetical protein